jgi:hypothetical protein
MSPLSRKRHLTKKAIRHVKAEIFRNGHTVPLPPTPLRRSCPAVQLASLKLRYDIRQLHLGILEIKWFSQIVHDLYV